MIENLQILIHTAVPRLCLILSALLTLGALLERSAINLLTLWNNVHVGIDDLLCIHLRQIYDISFVYFDGNTVPNRRSSIATIVDEDECMSDGSIDMHEVSFKNFSLNVIT